MRFLRRIILCACVVVATSSTSYSGERLTGVSLVTHSTDVRALHCTGDTLWIGTGGGLYRYDLATGAFIDKMIVGDPLPSSSVRAINSHGDSVLVGTDEGLAVFSGDSVLLVTPGHNAGHSSIPLTDINSIDFGLDGTWFLGTFGHGLGVVSGEESWTITREDSLLDNKVYGVVEEADTAFYYATSMGLCAQRDSVWVGFQAGAGLPRGEVIRLERTPGDDGYYVLIRGHGIFYFDGDDASAIAGEDLFGEDGPSAMSVSGDALWAAGTWGGMAVRRRGRWTRVAQSNPDVGRWWRSSCADGRGGAFFGSADGVVMWVGDTRTSTIRLPEGLPGGDVHSLCAAGDDVYFLSGGRLYDASAPTTPQVPATGLSDLATAPDGALWITGRWGLYMLTDKGAEPVAVDTWEIDPAFVALCFDAYGQLWVAARSGAIYRWDGEIWMRMGDVERTGRSGECRLLPATGATVWAFWARPGSPACARFGGGAWRLFADPFGEAAAVAALPWPAGTVTALTGAAIWHFADGEWGSGAGSNDNNDNKLPEWLPRGARLTAIAAARDGRFLVGTDDALIAVDGPVVRTFAAEDGLGGREISDLLPGSDGLVRVAFRRDGLASVEAKSLWR